MKRLYDLGTEERLRVKDQVVALLAAESPVAFAYLYGSFAEPQPFHDIDVGVYLRGPDLSQGLSFSVVLAQRLSEHLKFPVDVRILNGAPASFLHHVLRGMLLVSHDDDLLGDVLEDTIRRYLDMAPLLRRSTKEAFAE